MNKDGSLCLKLGLKCFTTLPQSFFAFDNLLITGKYKILFNHLIGLNKSFISGSVAAGKTSAAKFFCHKLAKCPYFVKIIWIDGRFLAGY